MKEIKKVNKNSILKKIFIKICRFFNLEIIDQNNFYLPVTKQYLNEDLSIPGKRSLTLPMGNVQITRKVKSLTIILRTCSIVHMLTQTKKRLFEEKKSEYNEIVKKIISILETKIRPAVAKDGGDIKFKEFKDGIVKVELQGSCSGCPSSTMTLKQGVQNLLCHYIPEIKSVEAI